MLFVTLSNRESLVNGETEWIISQHDAIAKSSIAQHDEISKSCIAQPDEISKSSVAQHGENTISSQYFLTWWNMRSDFQYKKSKISKNQILEMGIISSLIFGSSRPLGLVFFSSETFPKSHFRLVGTFFVFFSMRQYVIYTCFLFHAGNKDVNNYGLL